MAGLYSSEVAKNNNNNNNSPISIETKKRSELSFVQSLFPLRMVGYGLIILIFFDWVELFYPPQFMNPAWEFQAFGQIVERAAIPLIGLCFIFFAGNSARASWEAKLLKFLHWLTLLLAIIYFLLIPLGIANTFRINRQNTQQISNQSREKIDRVQQIIANSQNPEEVRQFIANLTANPQTNSDRSNRSLQELKKQANNLSSASIHSEAEKNSQQARRALLKRSIKWNLGALISGFLFAIVWDSSRWVRNSKLN